MSRHAAARTFPFSRPPAVLLVVVDPDEEPKLREDAIRRAFLLTRSQARLAAGLAAGKSVSEYAEMAGVSQGTIRQLLKQLFERTGVRRQSELVRLVLSSVARTTFEED
jgi:DNA-binding CsgD family transcriptional regulator